MPKVKAGAGKIALIGGGAALATYIVAKMAGGGSKTEQA